MTFYYERPTQVRFIETEDASDEPRWIGGIAYEDYIICGECGSTIEAEDIASLVELNGWADISDAIVEC